LGTAFASTSGSSAARQASSVSVGSGSPVASSAADAILLGAVGGPKWDDPSAQKRPEQGLLAIRKGLELYANLRPVMAFPALVDASPLRAERVAGVDLLVVRELTGGLYFGPRTREQTPDGERATDLLVYTEREIERVARLAFELTRGRRKKLTSVDKANVIETSRLWRSVVNRVAREYPDVSVEHQLVDSAAMRLVTAPAAFDVLLTENMFGDILSDEASVIAGSLGLLPSASLGATKLGLYEPIHGSAPDIAGKGVANPLGTVLSAAMLLRLSLGLEAEARTVEVAVQAALDGGARTRDLGGSLSTSAMTAAVRERL
jgi:3-isopropylmalate dehydrogenase